MNTIIATSIGSAAMTYEVIAVLGYLTFGDHVGILLFHGALNASDVVFFFQLSFISFSGRVEYHTELPFDFSVCRFWTVGNCSAGVVLVPVAGATLSELSG